VHPGINEAKIVASYHQTSRYHQLPLVQMLAAEKMLRAGGRTAVVGQEFIDWASEDLQAYARYCYDAKTGRFNALMIDGTPIQWQKAKEGYYIPSSFAPVSPEGGLLWSYALAWRLTQGAGHWIMLQNLLQDMGLGELGGADGSGRALNLETDARNSLVIYALLDLYDATGDDNLLRLACRVADNLLAMQTPTGLFPRPEREWARTSDDIPLALLHLAAAIEGRRDAVPPPITDRGFFHAVYYGDLEPHQQKRADERTYDHYVYYGS